MSGTTITIDGNSNASNLVLGSASGSIHSADSVPAAAAVTETLNNNPEPLIVNYNSNSSTFNNILIQPNSYKSIKSVSPAYSAYNIMDWGKNMTIPESYHQCPGCWITQGLVENRLDMKFAPVPNTSTFMKAYNDIIGLINEITLIEIESGADYRLTTYPGSYDYPVQINEMGKKFLSSLHYKEGDRYDFSYNGDSSFVILSALKGGPGTDQISRGKLKPNDAMKKKYGATIKTIITDWFSKWNVAVDKLDNEWINVKYKVFDGSNGTVDFKISDYFTIIAFFHIKNVVSLTGKFGIQELEEDNINRLDPSFNVMFNGNTYHISKIEKAVSKTKFNGVGNMPESSNTVGAHGYFFLFQLTSCLPTIVKQEWLSAYGPFVQSYGLGDTSLVFNYLRSIN